MSTFVSESGRVPRRARRAVGAGAFVASLAVILSALSPMSAATADTAPLDAADPRTPETVSNDMLPTPQIGDGTSDGLNDLKGSGIVYDQVVIGNTVYVGGNFQYARPAGAKAGENVVERKNFLAYDLTTGALLDYAPSFNAKVESLTASPDGTRLYVGGTFSQVNGKDQYRVAAFDVATGALDPSFRPTVNSTVYDVSATATTVYLAGAFTSVNKQERVVFAAVDARTGTNTAWAPKAAAGGAATRLTGVSILASPDGKKVILAGVFASINGSTNPGKGMAAVDATTGAILPWKVNATIQNGTDVTGITDLTTDGKSVFGSGYQSVKAQGAKYFEGIFKASWTDGTIEWMTDCHGDTYSVAPAANVVYTASHAHTCNGVGGFHWSQTTVTSTRNHRAGAFSMEATQKLKPWTEDTVTYTSYAGQPAPSLLDWYPDLYHGEFDGLKQSAYDVTTAGDYVLFGGEFTQVNQVEQRGLTRFAVKSKAPNKDAPQLQGADMKPTVTAKSGNWVRLDWKANYDRDNARLTYDVIRDGNLTAPVFTTTVDSKFWKRPLVSGTDGPLEVGSTHTYQIRTTDPYGNSRLGDKVSFTAGAVTGSGLSAYDRTVLQDQPSAYWFANEYQSTTMYDWVGTNDVKTAGTTRVPGVETVSPLRAITFPGTEASRGKAVATTAAPTEFSEEAWFKTTTKAGGKIIGFENASSHDRALYMDKAGTVSFGVYTNAKVVITAPQALNDGKWHHVLGSLDATGRMQFFVDGIKIDERTGLSPYAYSGSWVIGGGLSWADNSSATSRYFAGTIDNVAVYNRALTATEVQGHVAAASAPAPQPNAVPSAAFTSSVSDLSVSVDGSGSTDSDGSVASYAWSFGDGSTGSGVSGSHAFTSAGTYMVTLTVTDDKGASASSAQQITVAAKPEPEPQPGVVVQDGFDRSVSAGWGSAVFGGAWSQSGSSGGTSVSGGDGVIVSGPGQTRSMKLSGASSVSSDSRVSFVIDQSPAAASQFVTVVGRQVGADSYSARVIVQTNGVLQLQLGQNGTNLKVVNLPATYAAGQEVHVRLQVTGTGTTTLNAKAWTTGDEPADWTLTATDSTASLQAAGSVGLTFYLGGKGAETRVAFRDYTVSAIS